MNNKRRFSAKYSLLFALSLACVSILCGKADHAKKLPGTWVKGTNKTLTIYKERNYTIKHSGYGAQEYPGTFSLHTDTIKFVDIFCGTKLCGIYTFKATDTSLSLTLLKDDYCGREDFFPGEWKRQSRLR